MSCLLHNRPASVHLLALLIEVNLQKNLYVNTGLQILLENGGSYKDYFSFLATSENLFLNLIFSKDLNTF